MHGYAKVAVNLSCRGPCNLCRRFIAVKVAAITITAAYITAGSCLNWNNLFAI